ncbi:TolC family protein, partial [Paraburkholderia sp. Se-20369]|nr:TolC family protein [Paraburkholderia sp. Se-20369]
RSTADQHSARYLAGRQSFTSDRDATRTLASVHARVAAAEGQVAADQVRLFLALGGGWEADADAAPAARDTQPQAKHAARKPAATGE